MLLNDGSAKAEAQAHAFGFGCEKWREQILGNILSNAVAHVNDIELNPAMRQIGCRAFDLKRQRPLLTCGVVHRLHPVAR